MLEVVAVPKRLSPVRWDDPATGTVDLVIKMGTRCAGDRWRGAREGFEAWLLPPR